MGFLPSFLQQYEKAAKILFRKKAVRDIQFSKGGTYLVEVLDRKGTSKVSSFFPVLQVKDDGTCSDAFCTCPISEKEGGCPHIAAAFYRIFNETAEPLHVRFAKSFWNHLFKMESVR